MQARPNPCAAACRHSHLQDVQSPVAAATPGKKHSSGMKKLQQW
jgi:hypothetical protein